MGKCVRIRGSKPPPVPSSPAEAAAACLTLRSGRRVPVVVAVAAAAACSSSLRTTTSSSSRRHRGSTEHRCGGAEEAAAKRACAGSPPRGRVLVVGAQHGLSSDAEQLPPSQDEADNLRGVNGCGDGSFQPPKNTPLDGDELVVEVEVKQEHESKGVAKQPKPPAPPELEAEMETFFAAAELAERRRFAEAYNYDVALDRPLEGRFEWAPMMST